MMKPADNQDVGEHAETIHGGVDFEELTRRGLSRGDIIDFSSNILPYGPAPGVITAIRGASISSYPDRACGDLTRMLAARHHIDNENILVGNGCCELIHQIALGVIRPGDTVLVVGPTFSEYSRASRVAGGMVIRCDARVELGFAVPLQDIDEILASQRFRIVWICNPNNPTGQSISPVAILDWVQRYPDTVIVVDESYIDFVRGIDSLVSCEATNLVVLRSMTKAYAMAGLRLGYALIREPWLTLLRTRSIPWSVNTIAQAAGLAALHETAYYDSALNRLAASKRMLAESLTQHGFRIVPSETAFFLMATSNGPHLRERLLQHGLLVRDCSSFGLNSHVRIAAGTEEQNERLVARLTEQPVEASASTLHKTPADQWDGTFRDQLSRLFQLRRDVRRFRSAPIGSATVRRLLEAACMAPSVGLSQPWRFVSVTSPTYRARMLTEFESANAFAASHYDEVTQAHYSMLKLAGLREAPEQLAVFTERDPAAGRGLGRATMPESVVYSVVAAIQNLWLAARAEGIGVGWVSILRPEKIANLLEVHDDWQLVAYLCIGYPMDEHADTPELERLGWQSRELINQNWIER